MCSAKLIVETTQSTNQESQDYPLIVKLLSKLRALRGVWVRLQKCWLRVICFKGLSACQHNGRCNHTYNYHLWYDADVIQAFNSCIFSLCSLSGKFLFINHLTFCACSGLNCICRSYSPISLLRNSNLNTDAS